MSAREAWNRYPRTLAGAWHAIDDLRDSVREIRDEEHVKLRGHQQAALWIAALGGMGTFLHAVGAF